MKRFFICSLIFSLVSCTTNKIEREVSLNDLILDEIKSGFEKSELFEVYQLLTYYETNELDNTFLLESKNSLNKLLPIKLKELYKNNLWDDFFVMYNNLLTLNFDLSEYDIDKIILDYVIKNTQNNLLKSGVLLGEDLLNYSDLSVKKLEELKTIYSSVSPESDFLKLKGEFLNRKLNWDIVDNGNYIDGVMTIFVNKGISFEGGVGSQDIIVGSGFFIDKKGHAVTNHHVIESIVDPEYEGISNLYVKLNGSLEKIPAKVVGWDPILDLALIKVSTIPTYVYSFAKDEDELIVGEKVIAIGSPGGLGSTVTSGIVSAVDRTFLELGSVIQIDSAINPGNSGGPLINKNNEVSNIVFAGIEDFEGINFAIPVKYLKKGLNALYTEGERTHVWIGAGITYRKKKFEIFYIKPDSPASYIGLEKSDIINSINNLKFNSILDMQNYLMDLKPKEIIDIEYTRNKKIYNKKICLEVRPEVAMNNLLSSDSSDHLYAPLFGMDIKFTGKILWDREYLINDIYSGSIADELDLRSGDIIKVKNWEYNEEYEVVILQLVIQSQQEGFWEKTIQVAASINVNFFI